MIKRLPGFLNPVNPQILRIMVQDKSGEQ